MIDNSNLKIEKWCLLWDLLVLRAKEGGTSHPKLRKWRVWEVTNTGHDDQKNAVACCVCEGCVVWASGKQNVNKEL